MKKNKKIIVALLVAVIVITIAITAKGVYIYLKPHPINNVVAVTASSTDPVYLEIQSLMEQTQLSQPQVVENSLRSFDIDGDGDQDELGFLKLTFPESAQSYYIFSTWYRNATEFNYYESSYYDFTLYKSPDGDLDCSIRDLAIGKVTIACVQSGKEYLTTLGYQKNGSGYYRDVSASVLIYKDRNWPEYNSKKGGIRFKYPSDVRISERTYKVYNDLITIITAKRGDQILFEIKTVPQQGYMGGGVIGLTEKKLFIKLSDNTYLSRDLAGIEPNQKGVFYNKTNIYVENNVGSFGDSYDARNVRNNRGYVLFTPLSDESDLKEVDNVFASIKYTESVSLQDAETIPLQDNPVSLSDGVTLQLPGHITERQAESDAEKDFQISLIDSPIYNAVSLNLKLLPYGTVGNVSSVGGGGYDANKNGCYDYEKKVSMPKKIGINQVCEFGYGDAGFSRHGYYVIDPQRKYILSITQSTEDSGIVSEILGVDLKAIVQTVRFKQ